MWDLIVSVPDHCLSFYFDTEILDHAKYFSNAPRIDTLNICMKKFDAKKYFLTK